MENYDSNILIKNIRKLMEDNNTTQQQLADILGMSQSNVSKALSETDKKRFTLDQVVGIAKHYRVSIDMLVDNSSAQNHDFSPRSVAEFFVHLVEREDIQFFKHPVEEELYEPHFNEQNLTLECNHSKETIEYNAFYFPSYCHIPDYLSVDEKEDLYEEGNLTIHFSTNTFFHQFLQIYTLYKQKALEEETYRTVVSDLLNHLRD